MRLVSNIAEGPKLNCMCQTPSLFSLFCNDLDLILKTLNNFMKFSFHFSFKILICGIQISNYKKIVSVI